MRPQLHQGPHRNHRKACPENCGQKRGTCFYGQGKYCVRCAEIHKARKQHIQKSSGVTAAVRQADRRQKNHAVTAVQLCVTQRITQRNFSVYSTQAAAKLQRTRRKSAPNFSVPHKAAQRGIVRPYAIAADTVINSMCSAHIGQNKPARGKIWRSLFAISHHFHLFP